MAAEQSFQVPTLTDADFFLESLDPSLFLGTSSVEAHAIVSPRNRLADTLSARCVISDRRRPLSRRGALAPQRRLPADLSASVNVRVIGYGMPRVGNQDFANWVDSHLDCQVTHINNRKDPIPIVPGRFSGFHHISGEVHIADSGKWENCPVLVTRSLPGVRVWLFRGALTRACGVLLFRLVQYFHFVFDDVPNISDGSTSDHDELYDGFEMGC
ncbi:hypothetical protein BJY52DRAFT_1372512 [Lactarius psammicola]|nr:hypothetical protein BJY52DRAFT_1372512 [Lactarius psammicola]